MPASARESQASPTSLWTAVVDATNRSGDERVMGLRTVAYTILNAKTRPSKAKDALQVAGMFRSFLTSRRPHAFPAFEPNLPLILIPYGSGSNLHNLLPVVREARKRNLLGSVVTGASMAKTPDDVGPVVREVDLAGRIGVANLPRLLRSASISYRKLQACIATIDRAAARRIAAHRGLITRYLVWAERLRAGYSALFDACRPSCVLSTSDYWPAEFQLFREAQRRQLPNAMLQHGEFTSPLAWPIHAHTFLLWGDLFRHRLLALGAAPERLRVCGMPGADDLANNDARAKPRDLSSQPVCLLFSHAHDRFEEPELFAKFATYLRQLVDTHPDVRWQVKLHPAEDDSYYREQRFGSRLEILPARTSLRDAIAGADIAFTIRSTAGLQSMLAGLPLLIVDIVPPGDSVPWPQNGGGISARESGDFSAALLRLTTERVYREAVVQRQNDFLHRYFANLGSAAKSVVDFLEEQTARPSGILA